MSQSSAEREAGRMVRYCSPTTDTVPDGHSTGRRGPIHTTSDMPLQGASYLAAESGPVPSGYHVLVFSLVAILERRVMTIYTMRDRYDAQTLVVCDACATAMPATSETMTAAAADDDVRCDMCAHDQK